jgi:hypothetical protein
MKYAGSMMFYIFFEENTCFGEREKEREREWWWWCDGLSNRCTTILQTWSVTNQHCGLNQHMVGNKHSKLGFTPAKRRMLSTSMGVLYILVIHSIPMCTCNYVARIEGFEGELAN